MEFKELQWNGGAASDPLADIRRVMETSSRHLTNLKPIYLLPASLYDLIKKLADEPNEDKRRLLAVKKTIGVNPDYKLAQQRLLLAFAQMVRMEYAYIFLRGFTSLKPPRRF